LKSKVEYGFGLGQLTIAYDKSGNVRFNAFTDVQTLHKQLVGWKYEDRYDPVRQSIALVSMDKRNFYMMKGAQTLIDQVSFMLSGYNGGPGSVLKDRRLCAATKGCNSNVWDKNVELTSYKSKVAGAYSKSNYQINREYVRDIRQKSVKYQPFMKE
jgi:membrane-bound lytic murein transglycosylase MltF